MRLKCFLFGCAALLVSLLLVTRDGSAQTTCTKYPNSVVYDFQFPIGPGCIDEGPGCNECITTASRGVKICYYTFFNEAVYCYYGGQYPDNQIG